MRLNKTLRDAIVANWFDDKWKKRIDDAIAEFVQTHRDRFEAGVAHERVIYHTHSELVDRGFVRASSFFEFAYTDVMNHTPPRLRVEFREPHDRRIPCKPYAVGDSTHKTVDLDHDAVKKFAQLDKMATAQKDDLVSIVYGCVTVEKLVELVPGIEKYMPSKTSAAALPVPMDTVDRVKAFI